MPSSLACLLFADDPATAEEPRSIALVASDLHLAAGRDPVTGVFYLTEKFLADDTFACWLASQHANARRRPWRGGPQPPHGRPKTRRLALVLTTRILRLIFAVTNRNVASICGVD